jgi:hypothetical protein
VVVEDSAFAGQDEVAGDSWMHLSMHSVVVLLLHAENWQPELKPL